MIATITLGVVAVALIAAILVCARTDAEEIAAILVFPLMGVIILIALLSGVH